MTPVSVPPATVGKIVDGFLAAMVWADRQEGSHARVTKSAAKKAHDDVVAFLAQCGDVATQALDQPGYDAERFGHDFWLTRNGHGTGFWDRDELAVPTANPAALALDRDGVAYPVAPELGRALADAAYGTSKHISRFAHPMLEEYRGWLYLH